MTSSMDGIFLPYRPPRRKGELIVGYIWRAAYAGGHARMKDLARTLVDRQTIQPPWTVPSNLERLCRQLSPVFNSAQDILEWHTCLPAHLPFLNPAWREPLMAQVLHGVEHLGSASALGLGGRSVVSKPMMAMCSACLCADELSYGAGYWRREHALAGLGFCPHHGKPLETGCGNCRLSQLSSRTPLLPSRLCACGQPRKLSHPTVAPAEGQLLARMACYGLKLLEGALKGCSPQDIGAYFVMSAHSAGYADGTRVKSPALVADLSRKYTPAVLERLNASLPQQQDWIQKYLGARLAPNILGRNLLLFDFFGKKVPTPLDLEYAKEWMAGLMARRKGGSRTPSHEVSNAEIEADRKAINEYLNSHSDANRTQVLKALGRIVMRARERDSSWYDDLLMRMRAGRRPHGELERAQYWARFDDRACAHVQKRRLELLSTPGEYPKAITRAALLKGARRANEVTHALLTRLPKTKAAIEQAVESTATFKRRLALAVLKQPAAEGVDRVLKAKRRTRLPLAVIDELNFTIIAREA